MADDHSDPVDGPGAMAKLIILRYEEITRVLARLPIPIQMPAATPLVPYDHDGSMLLSMVEAYQIIPDEPVEPKVTTALTELLTEWLAAYELAAFITMHGPAPWRVATFLGMVERSRIMARMAGHLLPDNGSDTPESAG